MDFNQTTDELLKQLNAHNDINEYLSDNADELIGDSLPEFLDKLLKKYNLKKQDVIKNSQINQIYAYQIFSGKKTKPDRNKVLQIAFGMRLNLSDTQRLLRVANVKELYTRNKRDSIIIFSINKGFDINKCDDMLYDMNENTIISI